MLDSGSAAPPVRLAVVLAAVLLVAAACGSGDDTSSTAPESPSGNSADDDPVDDGGSSDPVDEGGSEASTSGADGGSFTVDGTAIEATMFRCELEEDFYGEMPDSRDLDLVARSEGGGLSIDLIHRDDGRDQDGAVFDQQIHELRVNLGSEQYSNRAANNAAGAWFLGGVAVLADQEPGDALDGPPFTVDGNRITGTMLLLQDVVEGTDTVEVSFDLEIPAEFVPC